MDYLSHSDPNPYPSSFRYQQPPSRSNGPLHPGTRLPSFTPTTQQTGRSIAFPPSIPRTSIRTNQKGMPNVHIGVKPRQTLLVGDSLSGLISPADPVKATIQGAQVERPARWCPIELTREEFDAVHGRSWTMPEGMVEIGTKNVSKEHIHDATFVGRAH